MGSCTQTWEATPLGYNRKHPCPQTRWHAYRMPPVSSTMASLYGVCLEGLTTYWTVPYLRQGQVVARNKYGGYWSKTRSTADSGGSSIPRMISITNISSLTDKLTTHQASPCHTGHTSLDEELGTSSCLPKTTTLPASCRYAWKAREDDHYYPHIHSNSKASPVCTDACDFIVT